MENFTKNWKFCEYANNAIIYQTSNLERVLISPVSFNYNNEIFLENINSQRENMTNPNEPIMSFVITYPIDHLESRLKLLSVDNPESRTNKDPGRDMYVDYIIADDKNYSAGKDGDYPTMAQFFASGNLQYFITILTHSRDSETIKWVIENLWMLN